MAVRSSVGEGADQVVEFDVQTFASLVLPRFKGLQLGTVQQDLELLPLESLSNFRQNSGCIPISETLEHLFGLGWNMLPVEQSNL